MPASSPRTRSCLLLCVAHDVFGALDVGESEHHGTVLPCDGRTTFDEPSSPVRAYEFDAAAVREMCAKDPALDHELCAYVLGVLTRRLRSARVRLPDLYAPHGAGEVP